MDFLKSYISQPSKGASPSGAETVERLVDRVQTSTHLEDRRDAVRALKSLSRKYRQEVGKQSMAVLVNVLQNDRTDTEITGYALDTLCNVMSTEPNEDEELEPQRGEELACGFTEAFISSPDHLTLVLDLLDDYDFHVRWPAVKVITSLLTNRSKETQEQILVSPMGIAKLMDLLSDSREVIRNDGLLLLIQLTKNNASIQKIVAFNGAFERLLEIIAQEDYSDGGIVVEDCLLLLLNLLKSNASNQNLFKENSFIQKLVPFFQLNSEQQQQEEAQQGGWSAQRVTNIHLMLSLVRTLVSPSNQQNQTLSCQRVLYHCGLLKLLCSILMASGVPADVLTETINAVSEAIRGCQENQEYFASVLAPSNPPRPAIVVLLMSMVNERQPFVLRCAVLYCFQCFLYRNQLGQSQIVQTLLPSSADANTISAGQLLCGGLFSGDALSSWFAATALAYSVLRNPEQKEQLLRVQLATGPGMPPVSLMQQAANVLATLSKEAGKLQIRVGLLMLLTSWLHECPLALNHFLQESNNVSFLISQISATDGDEQESVVQGLCALLLGVCVLHNDNKVDAYTKNTLRQIIAKRIGLETFCDKLNKVSSTEAYTLAAKRPQMSCKHANEVVFDHEFTRLFKAAENDVMRAVQQSADENGQEPGLEEHNSIVQQYQGLIREQDEQLSVLRAELEAVKPAHEASQGEMARLRQELQLLTDQNLLLRAHQGPADGGGMAEEFAALQREMQHYRTQCGEQEQRIHQMTAELESTRQQVQQGGGGGGGQVDVLTQQLDQMRLAVAQRDAHIQQMAQHVAAASAQQQAGDSAGSSQQVSAQLEAEKQALQERLSKANQDCMAANASVSKLEGELQQQGAGLGAATEELETVKKEQEDLLVLLADNDTKIASYRKRLADLGEQVTDDEGDFDLDDDDDDDDEDDS